MKVEVDCAAPVVSSRLRASLCSTPPAGGALLGPRLSLRILWMMLRFWWICAALRKSGIKGSKSPVFERSRSVREPPQRPV